MAYAPCVTRILLLTACLMTMPPAIQAEIDYKEGIWGHLTRYIGTYDFEAVLNDEGVSARLSEILGDDLPLLRARLNVHPPIGFDGTCLNLSGNAPHRGGTENAYLNVCPNGRIEIVLVSEDGMAIYTDRRAYEHLDWRLRAWIEMMDRGLKAFSSLPQNATFTVIQ